MDMRANVIHGLQLSSFLTEFKHKGRASQKLSRGVEKLVPQCPRGRNRDEDKIDALYYSGRMIYCATNPITCLVGSEKTYKQFLAELSSAEQNHRIRLTIQGRVPRRNGRGYLNTDNSGASSSSKLGSVDTDSMVWFQGQLRYSRDPRAPNRSKLKFEEDERW